MKTTVERHLPIEPGAVDAPLRVVKARFTVSTPRAAAGLAAATSTAIRTISVKSVNDRAPVSARIWPGDDLLSLRAFKTELVGRPTARDSGAYIQLSKA